MQASGFISYVILTTVFIVFIYPSEEVNYLYYVLWMLPMKIKSSWMPFHQNATDLKQARTGAAEHKQKQRIVITEQKRFSKISKACISY